MKINILALSILMAFLASCTVSSNDWSLHRGLTKNSKGELVPSTTLNLVIGKELLDIDPSNPDWEKIYGDAQKILDNDKSYNLCPSGYDIIKKSLRFERHGTYIMGGVTCKESNE